MIAAITTPKKIETAINPSGLSNILSIPEMNAIMLPAIAKSTNTLRYVFKVSFFIFLYFSDFSLAVAAEVKKAGCTDTIRKITTNTSNERFLIIKISIR